MEIVSSTHPIRRLSFDPREYSISTDRLESVDEYQRASIVRQVLDASPKVTHLVVEWCLLPDRSPIYSNLHSLHLILEYSTYKDRDPFDIDRLVQLAPGLRRLETSVGIQLPHQKLVIFILDIVTRFHQLVHLVINKVSCYPSTHIGKNVFLSLFVAACQQRGYDGSMMDMRFYGFDEIDIWL